jgi:hypothetical protein
MDCLEDRGILGYMSADAFQTSIAYSNPSDVSGGSQSQPADETCAHVGQDVTIKIWHDHHPVRERSRVGHNLAVTDKLRIRGTIYCIPGGKRDPEGPRHS